MKLPTPDKMNFLIVDDMDTMRKSVRTMLKLIKYGNTIVDADNGRDAWEILETGDTRIHFIISDWNMPIMSGTELLNRVRTSKKYRDVPFLMITSEANKEVVAEAAENEVDAYLTKPFVTASLEQKIKELVHHANNPEPLTQHLITARDLGERGAIDEAIAELEKAHDLNPRISRPLRELGKLYLKKNDLKQAIDYFEKATEINMLDVTSFHYLGQLYYRMGKSDKALEYFSTAMEISPRHSDRAMKFAKLLIEKKKLDDAEKILHLIVRNKVIAFDLKEDIGNLCFENGLFEMTAKICQEGLHEEPGRYHLYKKLGVCLHRMGENKEAIAALETAAEKIEDDKEVFLEIASCYLENEKIILAEKWARKVIVLDPKNKAAKEILDKCL